MTAGAARGHRAVLFDLGGVVLGSPLHAIARFEEAHAIAGGSINRVVLEAGPAGGWARLERGELDLEAFFEAFERDCRARGVALPARSLMEWIAEAAAPRPAMLEAVRRIRARGLATAALTNNWAGDGTQALAAHFDLFLESSVLGLRKPDPAIYRHACGALGVEPHETVFLDDIGLNLKPARAIGMTTIKVVEPEQALGELAEVLGFPLGN